MKGENMVVIVSKDVSAATVDVIQKLALAFAKQDDMVNTA